MQRVSCLRYLGACATHTRTLAARSMATHATPMHTKRFHPVVSLSPEVRPSSHAPCRALLFGQLCLCLHPESAFIVFRPLVGRLSLCLQVHQYFEEAFGSEHLTQLLQHMPRPPLCCTIRVNTLRATAEDVLSILAEKLPIEDRAILGTRTPFVHPQLPNIICVPGAGPNSLNFQGARAFTSAASMHRLWGCNPRSHFGQPAFSSSQSDTYCGTRSALYFPPI